MARPTGSKRELEQRRVKAVLLLEAGMSVREVADLKDVTRQSVYRWKNVYEENGLKGLKSKPNSGGRSRKVSDEQLADLATLLEKITAESASKDDPLTLQRITEIIEENFDVDVSVSSVRRYLLASDIDEDCLARCVRQASNG